MIFSILFEEVTKDLSTVDQQKKEESIEEKIRKAWEE
jgi:hypothetical protein